MQIENKEDTLDYGDHSKYMVNEVPQLKPDSVWLKNIHTIEDEWIDKGPIPGSQIKIEDVYFEYLIDTNLTKK